MNTFNLHFLLIDIMIKPVTNKYLDCISLLSWYKWLWSICNSLYILYKCSTNFRSWSIHLYSYWFVYIIYARHLFDTNTSLIFLKATSCSLPQCQLTFFTNNSFNSAIISDKFGINLPTYSVNPTVAEHLSYYQVLVTPLCFLFSPHLAHWLSAFDPGTLILLFWIEIYDIHCHTNFLCFQGIWNVVYWKIV